MSQTSRAPLRLLLVTAGKTIPNWLFNCLEEVERTGAAACVLVLPAAHEDARGFVRLVHQLRHFLFALHHKIDRQLFRRMPDALASIDLAAAFPHTRVIQGAERGDGLEGAPVSTRLDRTLRTEQIDLVLDPFSLLPERFAAASKYGVWRTTFGQSGDPRTQSTPGFWEVIEGRPSTEARVCIHRSGVDKALVLYASVAPTDRRSVSRSQNHVYWKLSAALARGIRTLWEDADGFFERRKGAAPFAIVSRLPRLPGNLEMLGAWTSLARRYASDKWASTLYREQWTLAYHTGGGDRPGLDAFQKLIPPRDRIWADPFPLRVGNDYYIFHEELLLSTGKGSIVLTMADADGRVAAPPVPILERDYHLSYPFVFQWDGDYFMIPETGAHHQIELYHCVSFPSRWKLARVLLPGVRAFDPTVAFVLGRWWMFATIPAYGVRGTSDELCLFCADSPLGPWTAHRNNPIKSDVRSARPAGRVFESQGQYYRPAQDCSRRYGYAVSINHILQLSPDTYEEVEVERIAPNGSLGVAGVHTFNTAGNMTVIDCLMQRNRLWLDHS
jgi:hypothetical protein